MLLLGSAADAAAVPRKLRMLFCACDGRAVGDIGMEQTRGFDDLLMDLASPNR